MFASVNLSNSTRCNAFSHVCRQMDWVWYTQISAAVVGCFGRQSLGLLESFQSPWGPHLSWRFAKGYSLSGCNLVEGTRLDSFAIYVTCRRLGEGVVKLGQYHINEKNHVMFKAPESQHSKMTTIIMIWRLLSSIYIDISMSIQQCGKQGIGRFLHDTCFNVKWNAVSHNCKWNYHIWYMMTGPQAKI